MVSELFPAVTRTVELVRFAFHDRANGRCPSVGLVTCKLLWDREIPMNSESGRGGRIRTSDPLRPSATSCDHTHLLRQPRL
jgi:hypothetical protein